MFKNIALMCCSGTVAKRYGSKMKKTIKKKKQVDDAVKQKEVQEDSTGDIIIIN